eukprot:TRINITY_DN53_c0_g1_i1.p1 TRINITY_DN53_c0_g1~~TRINITY_DN53_c0_g1_i1.p1  ORF type:complete len:601 (+),score=196.08 TRINITY_DN53_c0_g1_i1:352-2154(+)
MPPKGAKAEKSQSPDVATEKKDNPNPSSPAPIGSERKGKGGGSPHIQDGTSPRVDSTTHKGKSPAEHRKGGEGSSGSPFGGPRKIHASEDKAENEIFQRINKIGDKIEADQKRINAIRGELDAKDELIKKEIQSQAPYKEEIKSASDNMKDASSSRAKIIDQLKEARRLRGIKQERVTAFKKQITAQFKGEGKTIEETIANLDEEIRNLERLQTSSTFTNLRSENQRIKNIADLERAKRNYRELVVMRASVKEDDDKIVQLEALLDDASKSHGDIFTKREDQRKFLTKSSEKITAWNVEKTTLVKEREDLRAHIKTLRDEEEEEWKKIHTLRKAKHDELQEKRKRDHEKYVVEQEKRKAEQKKAQEERRKREEERKQKELLQIPYEDEMRRCDNLIQYLQPLVIKPPKPTEAAVSPTTSDVPVPEGFTVLKKEEEDLTPLSKRNKQKAAKKVDPAVKLNQEIKHRVEVFLQFDELSLVPPSKYSDVEKSLAEVRAKKDYYKKASDEKRAERKAQLEAEAKAKQEKANKKEEDGETAEVAIEKTDEVVTETTKEEETKEEEHKETEKEKEAEPDHEHETESESKKDVELTTAQEPVAIADQ